VHLNDDHRWTREQIADWVQTIEPPQASSERTLAGENDLICGTQAETLQLR
jgi:hypothetical protein